MSRFDVKRKLAAALCAAMLCQCAAPAAMTGRMALAEEGFSAAAFSLSVATTESGVRATISGADDLPITVGVYNSSDDRVAVMGINGSGTVNLPLSSSGSYYVKAYYNDDTDRALVRVSGRFAFAAEEKDADEPTNTGTTTTEPTTTEPTTTNSTATEPTTTNSTATEPTTTGTTTTEPTTTNPTTTGQQGSSTGASLIQPIQVDLVQSGSQTGGSGGQSGLMLLTGNDEEDEDDLTIKADVQVSGTTITVTVTQSDGDRLMGVALGYDDVRENVKRGEPVVFSDLSAGTYEIEIDYMEKPYCPSPFSKEVEVKGTADSGADIIDKSNPQEKDTTPAVPTQFEISASVSEKGEVLVTITGAIDWELEARLLNDDTGEQVGQTASRIGNGQISLGRPTKGEYTVSVSYVSPAEGINARTADVTIAKDPEIPADPTEPTVTKIEASVKTGPDFIDVTVTTADSWQLYVAVGELEPKLVYVGDTAHFGGLEKGKTYDIEADYVNAVAGVSPFRTSITLPAASAIAATATAGVERIDVSVTAADLLPVTVTLKQGETVKGTKEITAGTGAVAFDGLAAGTYSVSVDYSTPKTGVSPTVIADLNVVAKRAAITDLAAVAGENQISITGRAQPGSDVTLTTEPASTTAIVHVDEKGSFTTTITCAAGTYTAIHAQYGTETETRVTLKGSFVVTPPVIKPTLEIDYIASNTLTVIARTLPGVKVNLSAGDYAQTVTADANGLLRYSLPHTYARGTVITFTVKYGKDNAQSFQQTATVGDPIYYRLLKRGSYGSDVYALTQRLADLGYPVKASSSYTDAVAAAVRLFQRANGLSVDGMAGHLTQAALYSLAAVPYGGEEYPTLVRGDRGLALIYTLQQRLKDLGYYSIRVDGIFGSATQRAVRWFQQVNGLTATGVADSVTQKLLYSSAAKPASGWPSGDYVTLSRSRYYNARVVPLQRRLKALGYLSGSADGYFGTNTYRAVRNFQSRNGLTVTGVADPYTQEVLYSSSAKAASGSSSSSGSSGYRLLYWGCKGDSVRRLQQALLNAGYKQVRTADGIYGKWTYDAVRAFQKDHGLAVDGIAGKNTQNALYGTSY